MAVLVLALLVRAVFDLIGRGESFDVILGKAGASGLCEIAESNEVQRMAGRADLMIDLKATL